MIWTGGNSGGQRTGNKNRGTNMQGYKVLRFSDREIFENLRGVIERINENL